MHVRGQHHVIELLDKHGRGEERHRPQGLLARVGEVVSQRRRQDENAARPDLVLAAVFQAKFAGAREDILRLLGRIGMPAEAAARLDLIDDGRGRGRSVPAISRERAGSSHRGIIYAADLRARKSGGIDNEC